MVSKCIYKQVGSKIIAASLRRKLTKMVFRAFLVSKLCGFQVVVLGDGSSGKTSLCQRFARDAFDREYHQVWKLFCFPIVSLENHIVQAGFARNIIVDYWLGFLLPSNYSTRKWRRSPVYSFTSGILSLPLSLCTVH